MKFRRKSFRRTRPRARRADVVPISLCRQEVGILQGGDWTCATPAGYLFPLADGGALDAILRVTSAANERLTQGMFKGLLWAGGALTAHWSFVGDPTSMLPGPLASIIGIWQAIVMLETNFDSATGIRTPGFVPNLASGDEEQTGDILHRWYDRISIISPGVAGPSPTILLSDNSGAMSSIVCTNNEPSCFVDPGTGCNTLRRQIIKTKRRLKENAAVYYCVNVVPGFISSADYTLGFDLYGYQAIKPL